MKAVAVFPHKREVAVVERAEPRISSPGQVKLRMLEVGVCGTDKDICAFQHGTAPPGSDHFILGHESLGEVIEAGSDVRELRPGDLVVAAVRQPCPHAACVPCRSGHQDFCLTGDYREHGIKDLDGFMTEFVVEDRQYLHVVPRKLRSVAVLVEPLTIAEKAFLEAGNIQSRLSWTDHPHKAVVLGAGAVGLLGAMVLVSAGFETYVYSRASAPNPKADIAESIGARYISSQVVSVERMAERVGNFDLVYEAIGASQLAFEVLKFLGPNGVFIFTGSPRRGESVGLDTEVVVTNLVLKNQLVLGTVNAGRDAFEKAIRDLGEFASRWPQAVSALITGRYPMEEFRDPVLGRSGGIKNVIALDGYRG